MIGLFLPEPCNPDQPAPSLSLQPSSTPTTDGSSYPRNDIQSAISSISTNRYIWQAAPESVANRGRHIVRALTRSAIVPVWSTRASLLPTICDLVLTRRGGWTGWEQSSRCRVSPCQRSFTGSCMGKAVDMDTGADATRPTEAKFHAISDRSSSTSCERHDVASTKLDIPHCHHMMALLHL